jgi:hypothetical protein
MPSIAARVCSMKLMSASRLTDRCAAVSIISFVSTVILSLCHVLTHAGVRPTLRVSFILHRYVCSVGRGISRINIRIYF